MFVVFYTVILYICILQFVPHPPVFMTHVWIHGIFWQVTSRKLSDQHLHKWQAQIKSKLTIIHIKYTEYSGGGHNKVQWLIVC